MALAVLVILGALLGWLSSILARTERAGEIMRQIGLGLIAALIAGLFFNQWTILGGLSLMALGMGIAAAIILLTAHYMVFVRRSEA